MFVMKKVKLSKEDKHKFIKEVKKLNAYEFILASIELEMVKNRFTLKDWKFITSTMGKRAHWFLKNVAHYNSFTTKDTKEYIGDIMI